MNRHFTRTTLRLVTAAKECAVPSNPAFRAVSFAARRPLIPFPVATCKANISSSTRILSAKIPPPQTPPQTQQQTPLQIQTQKHTPPSSSSAKVKIPSRMLIGFTCNKCSHRTHKLMSKKAYETGVVIITCDGCASKHLIADHLGWFNTVGGKVGTIEDIIQRKGGDRDGNMVVRLKPQDVLTGDSDADGVRNADDDTVVIEGSGNEKNLAKNTNNNDDGLMEWLPKRADEAAMRETTFILTQNKVGSKLDDKDV
ncbi:hypothetical protein HK100_011170 [Physocladia obscura]|uniref:DNL-type domain-containing protein n=1 Tax=Physocladia obscura TaxID=109957 RepID=A0AAD5T317_9FUNG|nr:hypothetical protein HK100_011170 [Physocladia obscura]